MMNYLRNLFSRFFNKIRIDDVLRKVVRRVVFKRNQDWLEQRFDSKEDIILWAEVYEDIGDELMYQLKLLEIEGKGTAANIVRIFQRCHEWREQAKKKEEFKILLETKRRGVRRPIVERSEISGLT